MVSQGPRPEAEFSRLSQIELLRAQGSLLEIQEESDLKAIREHNEETKSALNEPLVGNFRGKERALSQAEADQLVKRIAQHPTHGEEKERKYDPDDCYGFCFGRAILMHHEAIRRGVDPEAIKKIWAVGSLENEKWHFHVSTIIKGHGLGAWWATDTIYRSAVSVKTWMARMENSADTERLMFFVTDPRRFSVYSPQFYTGLDFFGDGQSDFYRGYFRDYFEYTLKKNGR